MERELVLCERGALGGLWRGVVRLYEVRGLH